MGLAVDRHVEHLDPEVVMAGDWVIGSLPVNLAGMVCQRGGRYLHLSLSLPREYRGSELSAEEMEKLGATLEEYRIIQSQKETP